MRIKLISFYEADIKTRQKQYNKENFKLIFLLNISAKIIKYVCKYNLQNILKIILDDLIASIEKTQHSEINQCNPPY